MSHAPERTEKNCLNCGTTVQGRYCHACGQENIVPKESFGSLVIHFFYDITHFDSKFFDTLRYLFFKPGFLSLEYITGRRVKYFNPVRMYVFTSAFFFLIFFSITKPESIFSWEVNSAHPLTNQERLSRIRSIEDQLKEDPGKSFLLPQLELLKDTTKAVTLADLLKFEDSLKVNKQRLSRNDFLSFAEYDSVQKNLLESERDGWFIRQWMKRKIAVNAAIRKDPKQALQKITDTFLHKLPYMLFVSLPLFTLILKLLYIRRKQFYYTDHGIFSIHLYIFTFLLLLVIFGFNALQKINGLEWVRYINIGLFFLLLFYLYKAMRRFYGQGRSKTLAKFFLLNITSFIMMLFLSAVFFFLSAISI